jgi:hypothetical protein
MAISYSMETTPVSLVPPARISDVAHRGRTKVVRNTINLAAQPSGENIYLGKRPVGSRFLYGMLTTSVTLGGTATVAVGTLAANGKYRAAATFTAVDTPTPFGVTTALAAGPLSAEEDMYLTVGAAALPASGTLIVDIYFAETA